MNGEQTEAERMPRAERLGCLYLTFLKRSQGLSFEEIRTLMPLAYTGEFESARRKFERDKETLRKLGIPLRHYGPGTALPYGELASGHVYIPEESLEQLGEIPLSEPEREALASMIVQALEKEERPEKRDALSSIYIKLFYKNLPANTPFEFFGAPGNSGADQKARETDQESRQEPAQEGTSEATERLGLIQEALQNNRVLEAEYGPAAGGLEKRTLEPAGLIYYRGRWCLVARPQKSADLRFYYLERFQSLQQGKATFVRDRTFNLKSMSLHPLGINIHEEKTVEVEIANDYRSMFSNFLSGLPQERISKKDGFFQIKTTNERALFRWILQRPEALSRLDPGSASRMQAFLKEIQELY